MKRGLSPRGTEVITDVLITVVYLEHAGVRADTKALANALRMPHATIRYYTTRAVKLGWLTANKTEGYRATGYGPANPCPIGIRRLFGQPPTAGSYAGGSYT